MGDERLTFRRTTKASAAEAYRALTRSTVLREWVCDGAMVEARPGGRYHFWWHKGILSLAGKGAG